MEINGGASSIYTQYQSLVDRYKSGAIDYQQAVKEHNDLKPQLDGNTGISIKSNDLSLIRFDASNLVLGPVRITERFDVAQKVSEHQHATQTYGRANKQLQDGKLTIAEGSNQGYQPYIDRKYTHIVTGKEMGQMRANYNTAASGTLGDYAANNPTEWRAGAQELGISIDGWNYGSHFLDQRTDSGIDVSVGIANSKAEKIFRHIASAADVAKFNAEMAPIQQEMHMFIDQRTDNYIEMTQGNLLTVLETTNANLTDFTPNREILTAAGLTKDDMKMTQMFRDESGHYTATDPSDQAKRVESIINNNPDVRAIYDAKWDRLMTRHIDYT